VFDSAFVDCPLDELAWAAAWRAFRLKKSAIADNLVVVEMAD
jgi:hypothetical protein